jgi:hypothetical protein
MSLSKRFKTKYTATKLALRCKDHEECFIYYFSRSEFPVKGMGDGHCYISCIDNTLYTWHSAEKSYHVGYPNNSKYHAKYVRQYLNKHKPKELTCNKRKDLF